jgi:hypothetical protein
MRSHQHLLWTLSLRKENYSLKILCLIKIYDPETKVDPSQDQ